MRPSLSTHYLHVFYLHRPDSRALVEERLEALVGDKRHSGGGGREKGKMLFDEKQLPGRKVFSEGRRRRRSARARSIVS